MSVSDLTGKLGLDTTDYKTAVREANRVMRVLESSFRASAAALGDWANDASGLELRIKSLTDQIEIQKGKVGALDDEYKRLAKEKGENSRAAQDLQIKLNRETETLNKMQRELGDTQGKLANMGKESSDTGKDVDKLGKEEDGTSRSTKKLGDSLAGLSRKLKTVASGVVGFTKKVVSAGVKMAKAVAAIAAAVVLAAGVIAKSVVGAASDLNEATSKTEVVFGDAAEAVKQFAKDAAESLGISELAALSAAGTFGNLFKEMGFSSEAAANMSINLVQLASDIASFNNVDPTDVLENLRSGLTGETEPLKKYGINLSAAAVEAKALELGLIKAGEEMSAAAKAQATYALVMEQTGLAQGDFERTADGVANQSRILQAQWENMKAEIGQGLLPATQNLQRVFIGLFGQFKKSGAIDTLSEKLGKLGDVVQGYVTKFVDLLQFADDPQKFAQGFGKLIAEMITDAAKQAPALLKTALEIIRGLITAIITALPELLPVATEIIGSLIDFIADGLPLLIQAGVDIVLALINAILPNLPKLIDAGIKAILALVKGIAKALPQLIPMIARIIPQILEVLIENLPMLIDAGVELILALVNGLIEALPILIEYTPEILNALVNALIEALPVLAEVGGEIIGMLIGAIISALPLLLKAALKILDYLATAIVRLAWTLREVGKNILAGIWEGIQQNADEFRNKILDFFKGIVDGIKEFLGISSPSKLFGDLGENSGMSYVNSFGKALSKVKDVLKGEFDRLAVNFSPQMAPAFAQAAAQGPAAGAQQSFYFTITQIFPDQVRNPDQWKAEVARIAAQESEQGVITAIKRVRTRRSIYGV